MKKLLKKVREKNNKKGFTLIEMLLVLFIIAVLLLLILPNMASQKDNVQAKGDEALQTTYDSQASLYQMDEDVTSKPSVDTLQSAGYLTDKQAKRMKEIGVE